MNTPTHMLIGAAVFGRPLIPAIMAVPVILTG